MIVVDTNIIGYLFLTSERSSQAEQTLLADNFWAVPLLWRSEFRNVLVSYIRKRIISLEDASNIMEEAIGLVRGREYEVQSFMVLRLAVSRSCTAYECEFVSLAKDLGTPLVTMDQQIQAQFPETAMSLDEYLANCR